MKLVLFGTAPRPHRRIAAVSLALLLAACKDGAAPLAPTDPGYRLPGGLAFSSSPIQDPAINQNDTHIASDATLRYSTTVETAEPVWDPVANQNTTQLTLTPPMENVHIEAGYDVYGQPLVNTYSQNGTPDPETDLADETRTVKAVGPGHSIYDGYGRSLPVSVPSGAPGNSPMEGLAYQGAQVTDGMLLDATADETVRSYNRGASFSIVGIPGTATKVSADRLRITASLSELVPPGAAVGSRLPESASGSRASPKETGTMTRTYARRDGKYVLEELVIETETKTDRATIRGKQHMQFRNVKWKENKEKDAERKDKREKTPRTPLLASPSGPSLNSGCDSGAIYDEFGNPCFPDGGGGDTGGGGGGYTDPCGPVAGGQNIVLQHGINSDSTMWFKRMKNWLRCDWQLSTELVPTFPSYSSHSDQSYGLMGRMDGTGQSGFVLIGHSQGGLVSRYTAQRFTAQGRGHLIEGVVTIGTPHQGAVLARNMKQAPLNAMYGLAGVSGKCGVQFLDASCHIKTFITQRLLDAFLTGVMNATAPATQDLQPGSQSLNHLNSQHEGFARYGIQHYAKKRWMPARLAGDFFRNPEDTWGGRNTVRYTEWAYQGLRVCNYASVFFGQFWLTNTCGHAHRGMDALDRGYDRLTAPGMQSDGIVHGPSQVYPNGMEQFPIHNGDSHVGEGQSNHTKDRLDFLLRNRFGVKERL